MKRTMAPILQIKMSLLWAVFALFIWCGHVDAQQNLNNPRDLMSHLYHIRSNYPDLYYDFVTRLNAFEYFENIQAAMDALSYSAEIVDGFDITVSVVGEGQRELINIDEASFRSHILGLLDEYQGRWATAEELISDHLVGLLNAVSRIEGLDIGLHLSGAVGNLREFRSLPDREKLAHLRNTIAGLPVVPSYKPESVGLDKSAVSGDEMIRAYEQSLRAANELTQVAPLAVLAISLGDTTMSFDGLREKVLGFDRSDVISLINPTHLQKELEELLHLVHESPGMKRDQIKRNRKALSKLRDRFSEIARAEFGELKRPILRLERAHPLVAGFRGAVGDCSTTNSACVPFAQEERVFWIRDPESSKIKGYIQFTRVNVDGRVMLYVNTISGALVSKRDARHALSAISSLKHLWGAAGIVLPVEEKIFHIINYPAIGDLYYELIAQGREVEFSYQDAADRIRIAPYIFDTLDLPETNKSGVYIPSQVLEQSGIAADMTQKELVTRDLYTEPSESMAVVIAFELKNRDVAEDEIRAVLDELHISSETFSELWTILEGNPQGSVTDFYQALDAGIKRHGLTLSVNELRGLPLLFRGHFAGYDSLSPEHEAQSMEYLESYLLAYTDISAIYDLIASKFDDLKNNPRFVKLIRRLFARLERETGMVLDQWELEHKSAYRTLIFLFEKGLPTGPYSAEFEKLNRGISKDFDSSVISDGNYLMRMILFARLFNDSRYHSEIMKFLKGKEADRLSLHLDHRFMLAEYFAKYMKGAPDQEVAEMGRFLARTTVGMSIAAPLGFYSLDARLDIDLIFNSLIAAEQPDAAAYLIHGGELAQHPQASRWLQVIYEHRHQIAAAKILDGFIKSPQWIHLGISTGLVDHLIEELESNDTERTKLVSLLQKNTVFLTRIQVRWLQNINPQFEARVSCQSLF